MKNFIFKSSNSRTDLYKILVKLDMLLKEQRLQRSDLAEIKQSYLVQANSDRPEYEGTEDGSSNTEHGE